MSDREKLELIVAVLSHQVRANAQERELTLALLDEFEELLEVVKFRDSDSIAEAPAHRGRSKPTSRNDRRISRTASRIAAKRSARGVIVQV